MFVISLISTAFALDCTGRNPDTCEAVNELAALVNAEMGSTVIADSGVIARFRTATIYNQLEAVRVAANADGCRTDGSFEGWTGGQYDLDTEFWTGAWGEFGGANGSAEGLVDDQTLEFIGDYYVGATDAGDIGEDFSAYNAYGQIASDRDTTGFMVGRWIRIVGRQGVFVTLHGECDGGVNVSDAFETHFRGELPDTVTPPPRVFINEVNPDPGTTNAFWHTGSATAGDSQCDGVLSTTQDEFVEIMNAGPGPADISGWQIFEAGNAAARITFPAGTILPAGQTATVWSGGTITPAACNFAPGALTFLSDAALSLNNSNETVRLEDGASNVVDTVAYGTITGDTSVNRFGDPDATPTSTFAVQGFASTPTHPGDVACADEDLDNFSVCDGDCDDNDSGINPGEIDIPGNGIDEDCDGADEPLCLDEDFDTFTTCEGDCNDGDASINPTAIDIPGNGIDEDCSGSDEPVGGSINAIFSQYVEGSSNNKALEVTNLGASSLDTSTCSIRVYSNGASTVSATVALSAATLATRESFVICNSNSGGTLLALCDQTTTSSVLGFNGNDALELVCDGTTQDIVGQIGNNPGTEWGTNPNDTADRTLFRDCGTTGGDLVGNDAFVPTASGWTGTTTDDFSGLGSFPVCVIP